MANQNVLRGSLNIEYRMMNGANYMQSLRINTADTRSQPRLQAAFCGVFRFQAA
jgi:hypothetical protein